MFKLSYPNFWHKKNALSLLLTPLSLIYRLLGCIRSILAKEMKFNAYVICVGNITAGGTGKTQIVLWLARLMESKKKKYVIITKAYGSKLNRDESLLVEIRIHDTMAVGDESILLADSLSGSKYGNIIASKNIKSSFALIESINPDYIIFDDGLQNPYFHKDLKILAIDGDRLFGSEMLIPAGPMRESEEEGFKNNDIIIEVISKGASNLQNDKDIYKRYKSKIFLAEIKPAKNIKFDTSKKYIAFSGIGNPEKFFRSLHLEGINLVSKIPYPDHYIYNDRDIKYLAARARELDAFLITTSKDYAKIRELEFTENININVFKVELEIKEKDKLINLINEKVFKPH